MKRRYILAPFGLFCTLLALDAQPPGPGKDKPKVEPAIILKNGDTNKDGKLSLDEFLKMTGNNPRLKDNPDAAKEAFKKADTNGDGFLSLEELTKLRDNLGPRGGPNEKGKPEEKTKPKSNTAFNEKATEEQIAFFEKKIRPILVAECYQCHSEKTEKVKGGLYLDSRSGIRLGGDSGAIMVAGDPAHSPIITALKHKDENTAMPPKKKLSDQVVADFETWIKMGAPDPREGGKVVVRTEIDIAKGREFWAFVPPKVTPAPAVKNTTWAKSEIDKYLLADMEKAGIAPVAEADKRTLLRRVYLDLIGLPPSGEEVEAFVFDSSPKAFEIAVDKLLASPQFGERWARHWLDVARYAESSGKTVNFNYPHAWRYRDYVIDSFNADKPYDRFIKEQLAGDLLPAKDDKQRAEQTIATGFLAIGPKSLNERMKKQFEMDIVDEQIDVTTQAFLGITAACARCHDHKFDPIPQKDYYALAGIFQSTETCYGTVRFVQANHPSPLLELPKGSAPSALAKMTVKEREDIEKTIADLQERMKQTKEPINNIFTFGQISINRSKLDNYDRNGDPKVQAMGVREKNRPTDMPVLVRGEIDQPGNVVKRGVLQVVMPKTPTITRGSGRLDLANWITDPKNPLTARVMVNRIWLHLFGRGIVPTPDNFGAAGQEPSNPALLDHLAISFQANGWSIKKLIRQIVLSRSYQLASTPNEKNMQIDPDNALVWRMSPRRLDAEVLRDSMMAVSGTINKERPVGSAVAKVGDGPSTRPRFGSILKIDTGDTHRSVYMPIVRDNLPESLALFDAADSSVVVAERATTSVPAQALFLMNNPFVITQAEEAATKLIKTTGTTSERVRQAYLSFFGRPPSEEEMKTAEKFIGEYSKVMVKDKQPSIRQERLTWAAFCQALFGSAEFLYRN